MSNQLVGLILMAFGAAIPLTAYVIYKRSNKDDGDEGGIVFWMAVLGIIICITGLRIVAHSAGITVLPPSTAG